MMREILFRGKNVLDGTWHYGSLQTFKGFSIFDVNLKAWHTVQGKTVGQYTGLNDKNGKRIFEGDIVRWFKHAGVVKYGVFNCTCCDGVYGWEFENADIRDAAYCEIIGNIHDNPELTEEEE